MLLAEGAAIACGTLQANFALRQLTFGDELAPCRLARQLVAEA